MEDAPSNSLKNRQVALIRCRSLTSPRQSSSPRPSTTNPSNNVASSSSSSSCPREVEFHRPSTWMLNIIVHSHRRAKERIIRVRGGAKESDIKSLIPSFCGSVMNLKRPICSSCFSTSLPYDE